MADAGSSSASNVRTGVMLLLAAAVLWSINGVLIKVLHGSGQGGWTIAAYRSFFAAIALTPLALRRWKPIADRKWVAATILFFSAMCVTFVVATTKTSAANAIVLQYTAPAWVFLVSPALLAERASRRQWVSLCASMGGVAVIFFSQFRTDAAGLSIGLASGLVFGMQSVLFRKVRAVDPVVLAWLTCAGSGLLLLPLATAIDGFTLTPGAAAWLIGMGVVQFGLPYVLYSAGIARTTAQQAILIVLLEPVLNPMWVWLVIREQPHAGTLLGGALIVASVAYLARTPSRTQTATRTRPP